MGIYFISREKCPSDAEVQAQVEEDIFDTKQSLYHLSQQAQALSLIVGTMFLHKKLPQRVVDELRTQVNTARFTKKGLKEDNSKINQ